MDRVALRGLRARGRHGVFSQEREEGQTFIVDLALGLDTRPAAADDDLTKTVHYGMVAEEVAAVVEGEPVNLIETLAERIAQTCLKHDGVQEMRVCVPQAGRPDHGPPRRRDRHHHPEPSMTAFTEGQSDPTVQPVPPSVVERVDAADTTLQNPRRAVLSLGSNLGNRLETLQGAIDALEDTPGLRVKAVSPVYETEPWGVEPGSQPTYFNAVIVLRTTLPPSSLLERAHAVEEAFPPRPGRAVGRPHDRRGHRGVRGRGLGRPGADPPASPGPRARLRPGPLVRRGARGPAPRAAAPWRTCSPTSPGKVSRPAPTWNSSCPSSR